MDFRDVITTDVLVDYLPAEYGHDLEIWQDGSTEIIESSLRFRNDAAPIVRLKCPGIGNLDSTIFSDGYAKRDPESGIYYDYDGFRIGDLADLIVDCCENADMSNFIDEIVTLAETYASNTNEHNY